MSDKVNEPDTKLPNAEDISVFKILFAVAPQVVSA
jgi:hypothetical protein